MTRRRIAVAVGVTCWLGFVAGVALIAIDPGRGWIGVTVIMGCLVAGLAILPRLRRQDPDEDDDGWAPMNRPEDPYGCHRGKNGGKP